MVKPPFVDKNGVKRGAWSEEEDSKLRSYILRHGHWNWRLLPKYAGLARCGKSCRLRWVNYLKPGVKRGNFSKEEADLIAKLHDQLGKKWSAIAAKFPGRTDNDIKNYWHTHIKKRDGKITTSLQEMQEFIDVRSCLDRPENNDQKEKSRVIAPSKNFPVHDSLKIKNSEELTSHVYILESSSSSSLSTAISEAVDSDTNSAAQQMIDRSALLRTGCSGFLAVESGVEDGSATSTSDSFSGAEDSFWTEPFMVDNSYFQDYSFSIFDEEMHFLASPFFMYG